mmetsp:Transcript_36236/g.94252  ORF Transcript_36236/g.94252 Transcript_36236/m.94252 type:complete len:308 (+) Transcript_36236:839-1762(+)
MCPKYLQIPYIYSGYRKEYSLRQCLLSLFVIHNETGNVYSHIVGCLTFIAFHIAVMTSPQLLSAYLPSAERVADFCPNSSVSLSVLFQIESSPHYVFSMNGKVIVDVLFFASELCMFASSTYHLLLCHSEKTARHTLKCDLFGIIFMMAGSFITGIYFGFSRYPLLQAVYLTLMGSLNMAALVAVLAPTSPKIEKARLVLLTMTGLSGAIPAVHWLFWLSNAGDRAAFLPSFLSFAGMDLLGLAFYLSRYPERLAAGRFDLWCHSHQFWHLLVFCGGVVYINGALTFASWDAVCYPTHVLEWVGSTG